MTATGTRPCHVAVVGAGIAGLAAAHRLVELSRERPQSLALSVLEAGPYPGGSIATERTGGFVIEAGPDSFISEKPWALALCDRIGLTPRLVRTRDEFRRTFVVHGGRLHLLPDGFFLLAPTQFWPLLVTRLFSWPGKLRMGLDLVLPRGREQPDESLGSFVTRRLGRQALERVAQPLVGGIYTADPDDLSLAATMPRFLEMERRYRSIIYAMWRAQRQQFPAARASSGARWSLFVSVDDGMQTLVQALADRLPEGALRCRVSVKEIRRDTQGWQLRCSDGTSAIADALLLATPAHQTAAMLADADPTLAEELAAIPYASSATVSLAYPAAAFPRPLDAFGFVVPLVEARSIIACTFSSLKYPGRAPDGFVLLRAFLGGALQHQEIENDDDTMVARVRQQMSDLLGVRDAPALARVHRHPRAMPQYRVGHLDHMARIDEYVAGRPLLALAGNAYRGVGIPDCIHSGEQAAEDLFARIAATMPTS